MTSFQTVYDALLSQVLDDEWAAWPTELQQADWRALLEAAIPHFLCPRVSLDRNDNGFVETLTSAEIQILAKYMRCEWLNRSILSYENLRPMYSEKDFSPANFIDKLSARLAAEQKTAQLLESRYYRSINYKPYDYGNLSGKH